MNILFCACVVWTIAGGTPAWAETAGTPQTIQMAPFHGPDVTRLTGYGNCQWLYPLDEPNETLASEPSYRSAKPVYYAARYGDAQDNIFTLVIDESRGAGTGFDTVYADLNNDNQITPDSERFGFHLGTTSGAEPVTITLSVSAGGKTIPYAFEFTAFPYKDGNSQAEKIHANCRNSTIMVGEAEFGGKRYKVGLADLDSNGLFNDYEQGLFQGDRFFVDLTGGGSGVHGRMESFPYAEYTRIDGVWYTVEASPDGGTVRVRTAEPGLGTVKAPANVKSIGLSSPKQFQRLEFEEAQAQALTGTYQTRDITLEIVDSDQAKWSTYGRYRQGGPEVVVEPNQETTVAAVLPLTIGVDVRPTSVPGVIEFEPRIADSHGGSFSTVRKNDSRHEPPARLAIKDGDGKLIAEAALEYG